MGQIDSFRNLYKKMDATSKTRFHASRRLKFHAVLSTYTVVFLSLVLIFISLMQTYGLGANIQSKGVGLLQVFSSVAVLVYSLLMDKNDYSSQSEKMYSCASKLGELKQKSHPYARADQFDQEVYDACQKEYHEVLKLYETHSNNDFRGDYYRAKLDMPEDYGMRWYKRRYEDVKWRTMYFFNFVNYPVVVGFLLFALYWVSFGLVTPLNAMELIG
jgi:hypothetical protein